MSDLDELQKQMKNTNSRQPMYYPQTNDYYPPRYVPTPTNSLGIAGMVLGIVSFALMCLPFFPFFSSVIGLVLSCFGMSKPNKGMAITGLILNIIVLLLQCLMVIGFFANPAISRSIMNI